LLEFGRWDSTSDPISPSTSLARNAALLPFLAFLNQSNSCRDISSHHVAVTQNRPPNPNLVQTSLHQKISPSTLSKRQGSSGEIGKSQPQNRSTKIPTNTKNPITFYQFNPSSKTGLLDRRFSPSNCSSESSTESWCSFDQPRSRPRLPETISRSIIAAAQCRMGREIM